MEITGTVTNVLPIQTGQGKKGEWMKQDVIIKTSGQYPKNVCISLWGEKAGLMTEGEEVTASIDLESREYNGRWYTEVRAWKISKSTPSTVSPPVDSTPTNNDKSDDLPF